MENGDSGNGYIGAWLAEIALRWSWKFYIAVITPIRFIVFYSLPGRDLVPGAANDGGGGSGEHKEIYGNTQLLGLCQYLPFGLLAVRAWRLTISSWPFVLDTRLS